MKENFHVLILAGGIGTRLWPKSRRHRPKQFLKIQSEVTLLVRTLKRAEALFDIKNIWVLCKSYHLQEVFAQLPDIPRQNIILEPHPKGTAAAIIYGSLLIEKKSPCSTVTVFPSDHIIRPLEEFRKTIEAGMNWASKKKAVVIYGIKPKRPETSYGYIEVGGTIDQCRGHQCMDVTAFHEKPDRKTARAYLGSKRFLWNSGMLSFSMPLFRKVLKMDAFSIWRPLLDLSRKMDLRAQEKLTGEIYSGFPEDSFDTAVLEKMARCQASQPVQKPLKLVVFPCSFEWHDMGIWESYYELSKKDRNGNALAGKAFGLDCKCSLLMSEGPHLVAAIGLSDMAIVCEGDAVLVCPRDQLDRVRDLVGELKKKGYGKYT